MPTDAQRRNLASAHHALISQHEETILWQAAEILKHLEKIALLEQQLAEAKRQMESQKDEWLAWDARRAALEQDAARYRWLFKGNKVYSQFFAAYQPWDGSDGKAGFDASIDTAISKEQT